MDGAALHTAPLVVATVVATLGAAMAFLWSRRGWVQKSDRHRRWPLLVLALAVVAAAIHDARLAFGEATGRSFYWLPYAMLPLAILLLRSQVDRFLRTTRELELRNAELGQRVAAQNRELRLALEQMRQARDAAEAADQAKTRFLAAASHDLRQPAHALGLYMATLSAGTLPAVEAEIVQRMQASLAALDSMFSALLDISRMDAGAVVPRWDLVPLAPLLRRLAEEWAPAAESRGLRLALHLSGPEAMTVSDPQLLERVLRNLLANAVKYTPQGGVLLACRLRSGGAGVAGDRAFRIEVWDSGIGIAAAERERVFEEFYQVGNPGRDRRGGLGLGLAIVRRVLRLLQLQLSMHSRPGRGSVFFIEGLAPAGALPRAAAAARSQSRRLAGTVVAVLEDDEAVLDAMRALLQLWECEVIAGRDAADLLRQQQGAAAAPTGPVAALIADVRLGAGRYGPAEAQALFAAWGRELPLLLVSGETAPDRLRELQAAGHICLAKPVSPARLRAWLEQAVPLPPRDAAPERSA